MLFPNVSAAETRQIRKTSYFRIQVVRGVYRTFISGEDGEADLERQARLSYVDFIPHYSTQESLLGRISFIFRIADIYASNGSSLAGSLAGTPGLTSLRFLSRQFPNSVPGDPWFIALLPVIPYCRWFTTEFRLRPATSSSFSSSASSAATVRRRRRVLFFSLLVLVRDRAQRVHLDEVVSRRVREKFSFFSSAGMMQKIAELWFEANEVEIEIARKSACAEDLCLDNCDFGW